ncbi:hypothetical protein AYO21_04399 [Fonsecaea monophora]|uniref:Uncharacterized protein n=1 Tax=Fonsecaea monophora TaxID=254056 RepID=A0A177FB00_9EURO|nr:hypothetical protein AYO21_04399 [Fonsecaea monophora]KAH0848374.1 hypothetical protein FOPE_02264 [Fonsecaea pedrosoi]OAG41457.1 hypothetical protein AYO21_04399 [Fonsecaea monophora]
MGRGSDRPVTFVFDGYQGSNILNKSTINAHVARQAHQRRREKDEALKNKGRSGGAGGGVENEKRQAQKQRHQQQPSSTGTAPRTEDYDSGYESGLLTPVILAGNSDPFSSKTIAVTPEVHRLLVFTRDFILPAVHANEASVVGGRHHIDRFWMDSVRALDDGGVAGYAYLARSAAILSTLTAHNRSSVVMALQYLGKATNNLRKSMAKRSRPDAQPDAWSVYALFCAEIAAGNLEGARVHGLMLRRLLQPDGGRTFDGERRLLMVVLQQDITRACLSLTRPSFDLLRWAEENLPARITDDLSREGGDGVCHPSAFPFSTANLSPSLSPTLRAVFVGVREWLDALGMIMLNRDLFNLAILINGAMRIMVLEGCLLNNYLDCMEDWELGHSPAALAEACLSLAALYWVRRAAHERMDAGSKLEEAGSWAFDMSRIVSITLRDLDARILQMETSSSTLPAGTQVRTAEDRLWCLYVGTVAECNVRSQSQKWRQKQSKSQKQDRRPAVTTTTATAERDGNLGCESECNYHGPRLTQLATNEMHLSTWSEIEAVAQRYLYVDMISHKTKKWYANETSRPVGFPP